MLHYIDKLHAGTHLMLGILTGDGPAPAWALAQYGNDTYLLYT